MYGAILGDIIGSPFEFDEDSKTKDFDLFTEGCSYTDDSVMTVAVAKALITVGLEADIENIKTAVVKEMQAYGKLFPNAGYGERFRNRDRVRTRSSKLKHEICIHISRLIR